MYWSGKEKLCCPWDIILEKKQFRVTREENIAVFQFYQEIIADLGRFPALGIMFQERVMVTFL